MIYKANFTNKDTTMKINKKFKIIAFILYILILITTIYVYTPIINPLYKESYIFLFVNILIILIIIFLDKLYKIKKVLISLVSIFVIILIGMSLLSSPLFNSQQYYELIGDVKTVSYENEKPDISDDLIPVVDYDLAQKLGDKVLGEDLGLGSQFDIGEYYLVSTNEDLAWVAPLEPQNFFKWFQNKNSIPGYIYVSATNPNDVRLVQEINGKAINIKYSDNSYFNHEINRYAYLNNNFTKGLTDYSFEIDDEGNPYWVITTYVPTIGFSGFDVSGIIVVNAQNGDINYYDKDSKDIPKWVDRIYPKDLIYNQLYYYGQYKNGWLNTVTSQKEMIQPTEGLSYVFIDGKPYFYTGMTSIKSDESTVGFIVTNIKNKDTIFYTLNGSTESAAKNSAQGKVQQYDYLASNPILLNVYDTPTYFMTLKDNDGLVKQYAFVSVKNYNIVGIGDNITSAKKDYYDQLKSNNVLQSNETLEKDATGTIERINLFEGFFYIKLAGDNNIYIADKDTSKELILTQENDKVKFKFINDDSEYKQITSFTNNTI